MRRYIWLNSTTVNIVNQEKAEVLCFPWAQVEAIYIYDLRAFVNISSRPPIVVDLEPEAAVKLRHLLYSVGIPDRSYAFVSLDKPEEGNAIDPEDSIPF